MHTKRLKTLVAFLLSFLFVTNIWQVQAEEDPAAPALESQLVDEDQENQVELPAENEERSKDSLTQTPPSLTSGWEQDQANSQSYSPADQALSSQQPTPPAGSISSDSQVQQEASRESQQGSVGSQSETESSEDSDDDDPNPAGSEDGGETLSGAPDSAVVEENQADSVYVGGPNQQEGAGPDQADLPQAEEEEPNVEGAKSSQESKDEPSTKQKLTEEPSQSNPKGQTRLAPERPVTNAKSNAHRYPVLTIGGDPSERHFTWYSDNSDQGYFEIAPYNEAGDFSQGQVIEGKTFQENNTHHDFFGRNVPDLYNTQVKIEGLEEDTTYMYRFWNDEENKSDIYTFKTHPAGDFDFLIVGDPQLGSGDDLVEDIRGWQETLDTMLAVHPDPNFLLSVGDQVEIAWREREYAGFIEQDGLNEITLAPIVGNHDTFNPAFSEHFALPNVQEEGKTEAGSNYYFTYNNALFVALNLENTNFEEHERTLQQAITATGDQEIDWRVVTLHRSLFSPANHSMSNHTKYLRENVAPLMNKYQIDIVLAGHDHSYARSHVMDGTNPQKEWTEDNQALTQYVDPEGVIYLTFNSSSGSKFYDLEEFHDFLAVRNQEYQTNFSIAHVTENTFEVITYRTADLSEVDRVKIVKTNTDFDAPLSQRFVPQARVLPVFQGDDLPEAKAAIENAGDLPEDTQYLWVGQVPQTNEVGSTTGLVRVNYNDGSQEDIPVWVEIIEKRHVELVDPTWGNLEAKEAEADNNTIHISVISDSHILAKELIAPTKEYYDMLNLDAKFFTQSEEVFEESLRIIDQRGVDYVLIPGDLTRDGEHATYEFIVHALNEYVQKGLEEGRDRRVFVVPGNHDINNPLAYDFANSTKLPLYTPQDFQDDFQELVYDQALAIYNESDIYQDYLAEVNERVDQAESEAYYAQGHLSYVSRIDIGDRNGQGGITILAIDSAIYSADVTQSGQNSQETGGIITEPLMNWLVQQAYQAHGRNDIVVAMAHHAFIPHFYNQEEFLSDYILRNWDVPYQSDNPLVDGKTPMEVFADNGIHFVFTGHIHDNDISSFTTPEGNTLYDIETGSSVSYPGPVRHMTFINDIDSQNTRQVAISEMDSVRTFEYIDADGSVQLMEDYVSFTRENTVTPRFVAIQIVNLISDYLLPSRDLINSFLPLPIPAPAQAPLLVGLVSSLLGTPEAPAFQTSIPVLGNVSLYWESDPTGLGRLVAQVGNRSNNRLYIEGENLVTFINELLDELDQKVLNEDQLVNRLEGLVEELFAVPVYTHEDGRVRTLEELGVDTYLGLAGGEESVKPELAWVREAGQQLKDQNGLYAVVQHIEEPLIDWISNFLSSIQFDLGQHLQASGFVPVFGLPIIRGLLPNNAESLLGTILGFLGIDDYKAFISYWVNSDLARYIIDPLNVPVGDLVISFNNELFKTNPQYAYLYDNDTSMAVQRDPVVKNGRVQIQDAQTVNLVGDFTANLIPSVRVLVNGQPVQAEVDFQEGKIVARLSNELVDGDQVAFQLSHYNDRANPITLQSAVETYTVQQEEPNQDLAILIGLLFNEIRQLREELQGQDPVDLQPILDRLDQLEAALANQAPTDLQPVLDRIEGLENTIQLLLGQIAQLQQALADHEPVDLQPVLDRIDQLEASIQPLLDRIAALEEALANQETVDLQPILDQIANLQASIQPLLDRIAALEEALANQEPVDVQPILDQIADLQASIQPLLARIATLEEALANQAPVNQELLDRIAELEAALEAQEPTDLQPTLDRIAMLEEALANQAPVNQELLNRIAELEAALETQEPTDLQPLLDRIAELEAKLANQAPVNQELLDRIAELEAALEAQEPTDLQSLLDRIAELEAELANQKPIDLQPILDQLADLQKAKTNQAKTFQALLDRIGQLEGKLADQPQVDLEAAIQPILDRLAKLETALANQPQVDFAKALQPLVDQLAKVEEAIKGQKPVDLQPLLARIAELEAALKAQSQVDLEAVLRPLVARIAELEKSLADQKAANQALQDRIAELEAAHKAQQDQIVDLEEALKDQKLETPQTDHESKDQTETPEKGLSEQASKSKPNQFVNLKNKANSVAQSQSAKVSTPVVNQVKVSQEESQPASTKQGQTLPDTDAELWILAGLSMTFLLAGFSLPVLEK